MAERKRRKPAKKRPSKNEFEEIQELKLKKEPIISTEDILDFKIDFGIYNKKVEKFLEEEKKNSQAKKQGKKKWLKRSKSEKRKPLVKGKKSLNTSQYTNTNLESATTSSK